MESSQFLEQQAAITRVLMQVPTFSEDLVDKQVEVQFYKNVDYCYEELKEGVNEAKRRPYGQSIMSNIKLFLPSVRLITYVSFMQSFMKMVSWLSIQDGLNKYALILDSSRKSSCWLGNIAWESLPRPWALQLDMSDLARDYTDDFPLTVSALLSYGIRHFVYFDDAGYSGRQLAQRVRSFNDTVKQSGTSNVKLFLCVPYLSKTAHSRILSEKSDVFQLIMYPDFEIIKNTSEIVESLGFSQVEILDLMRLLGYGRTNEFLETATTIFEHKFPDEKSFPQGLFCMNTSADHRSTLLKHEAPYKRPSEYQFLFPTSPRIPTCLLQNQTAGNYVKPKNKRRNHRR